MEPIEEQINLIARTIKSAAGCSWSLRLAPTPETIHALVPRPCLPVPRFCSHEWVANHVHREELA